MLVQLFTIVAFCKYILFYPAFDEVIQPKFLGSHECNELQNIDYDFACFCFTCLFVTCVLIITPIAL